ncbi:MAG: DUF4136 domain-containing protein [Phycisphaerae bacterium]|nr:DUF4136 domain-containing protein [Phycisphaerae bacterium]
MKILVKLISVLVLLSVAGCGVPVRVDFDVDTDFSSFRQYRWYDGEIHGLDTLASSPLTKKRVVRAVDTVLQEKGYAMAAGSVCDFMVFVHGTVQQRVRLHDTADQYDQYGGFGTGVSHLAERPQEEGVLYLDVLDGATQDLVWRGSLGQPVKYYKDSRKAQAAIEKTVRKILKEFPPDLSR